MRMDFYFHSIEDKQELLEVKALNNLTAEINFKDGIVSYKKDGKVLGCVKGTLSDFDVVEYNSFIDPAKHKREQLFWTKIDGYYTVKGISRAWHPDMGKNGKMIEWEAGELEKQPIISEIVESPVIEEQKFSLDGGNYSKFYFKMTVHESTAGIFTIIKCARGYYNGFGKKPTPEAEEEFEIMIMGSAKFICWKKDLFCCGPYPVGFYVTVKNEIFSCSFSTWKKI